ncbi:MAG: hypothetical protein GY821_08625 [Gammaproteobacteria bacterium]|nr:hypothetical protein [Gammaproteobacteria bacterium]
MKAVCTVENPTNFYASLFRVEMLCIAVPMFTMLGKNYAKLTFFCINNAFLVKLKMPFEVGAVSPVIVLCLGIIYLDDSIARKLSKENSDFDTAISGLERIGDNDGDGEEGGGGGEQTAEENIALGNSPMNRVFWALCLK